MHIAFLTPEYPHPRVLKSAGIGTSIKNVATGILKEKYLQTGDKADSKAHKISIIIYGQQEEASFKDGEIQIYLLPKKKFKLGGFYRYRKYINAYVNDLISKKQIDIIEAPDWTGITAFMKFKAPLVLRLHGTDAYFCYLENRTQKKKNYYFEKKALKAADAITSVSAFTANQTKELFSLTSEITVIHNCIDTSLFQPQNEQVDRKSILYFGSVIRKKGVLALAKAFSNLIEKRADINLTFLGKDVLDYKEQKSTISLIQEIIPKAFHASLHFVANVPYHEVQQHINKATLICLPSYAEAFPMTWLEAMSMEKPMVTSNIGWASELMEHNTTGLTVDPDNTEDLVQALNYILENPTKGNAYGKAARQKILEEFSMDTIINQNLQFYHNVLIS